MTDKAKKNYLIYTSVAFLAGANIYNLLVLFSHDWSISNFLEAIFLGGYLIVTIVAGIILFANVIKRMPLAVKILSIVFFFITYFIVVLMGFFGGLPYYIYCVVSLSRRHRQWGSNNESSSKQST